jgi:hypothetical protein
VVTLRVSQLLSHNVRQMPHCIKFGAEASGSSLP